MNMFNLIKTSVYSLKSHKLRVFLTMIGIIIGISSVISILAVGNGLKIEINKSMTDTSANKMNISFEPEDFTTDLSLLVPFNKSDMYYLKNVEGVEEIESSQEMMGISFISGESSYFDKKAFLMIQNYDDGKELKVKFGRSFREGEDSRKLIVLDYKSAETLFDLPEKALGSGITLNGIIYEVIGILEDVGIFSLMGGSSYISKDSSQEMNKEALISSIDVYIQAGGDRGKIFEEISKELELAHPNLKGKYVLQDPQAITKVFEKVIGGVTAFTALVTGISLFVGGIGVMNIMYASVSERKREIGIRRAIGAKPKSILIQFLLEASIVTGLGGIFGIFFGFIFCKIIGVFMPFPPVMSLGSIVGATSVSVIIGIIFGIIPAINASKLDPIKAIYK